MGGMGCEALQMGGPGRGAGSATRIHHHSSPEMQGSGGGGSLAAPELRLALVLLAVVDGVALQIRAPGLPAWQARGHRHAGVEAAARRLAAAEPALLRQRARAVDTGGGRVRAGAGGRRKSTARLSAAACSRASSPPGGSSVGMGQEFMIAIPPDVYRTLRRGEEPMRQLPSGAAPARPDSAAAMPPLPAPEPARRGDPVAALSSAAEPAGASANGPLAVGAESKGLGIRSLARAETPAVMLLVAVSAPSRAYSAMPGSSAFRLSLLARRPAAFLRSRLIFQALSCTGEGPPEQRGL